MESAPGEDAVKTVEILAKDLDYYINLVDKAAAESERNDFNFKSNSTQGKMLPSSIACYREVNLERKNQSRRQTSLLSYVKKLPEPLELSATTPLMSQRPPTPRQGPSPALLGV